MKKLVLLKLAGLAVLAMITLVIFSFLEVAVYAYLINPGQSESFYEAHANSTAPYISGIFGFLVFFFVARYWTKKGYENAFRLALLFPLVYILLDAILITAAGVSWSEFIFIFTLANIAKILGSVLGYGLSRKHRG